MTIIFVPAYDPATEANLTIADNIADAIDLRLSGAAATRADLLELLAANLLAVELFCMSHGRKDALLDNNAASALDENDVAHVANCKVFSWACHTGTQLGHRLAQHNVTWWGYDCAVTAPDGRAQYLNIFSRIFRHIKISFGAGADVEAVLAILETIKIECDLAIDALDQIGAADDDEAFSLYSCCNQIWGHLSVWIAGTQIPIKHQFAPGAYIDI